MLKRSSKKGLFDNYGYHIVIGIFIIVCGYATFSVLSVKKIDLKNTPVIDSESILKWNEEAEKYKYSFKTGENDFFSGWML
jgi:hypothetical protein